jgi:hypothetical protein
VWNNVDWLRSFLPAVQRFLAGGNPYAIGAGWQWFANPPWLLPLLVPFAWMGPLGGLAMGLIAISGTTVLCLKLVHPIWKGVLVAVIACVSIPFLTLVALGNVDGFVIWGLVLGGPAGFFLLSVKPQVASLVGLV